ncbi:hypothetical protein ACO0LO_19985 [Undibacterium sp. TJN25]|uniref:hypothetical protein n=1 Tax=Undibacterium sp. TJN25 TaxID=3413056 RepID=UPI003BEF9BC2
MTYSLKLTPKTVESLRQLPQFYGRPVDVVIAEEPEHCYPGIAKLLRSGFSTRPQLEVKVRTSATSVSLFWTELPDLDQP